MTRQLLFAGAILLAGAGFGSATTIADFTFETSSNYFSNGGAGLTVNTTTAQAAEAGSGATFKGVHSDNTAQVKWNAYPGDGASAAVGGTDLSINDYWEFDFGTNTFPQLLLTWYQTSSTSGPGKWSVQYTTDNWASAPIAVSTLVNPNTFATTSIYTVLENSAGNGGVWSGSGATINNYQQQFEFAAQNATGIRLYVKNDTNASGGTTFNLGSSSRIDNMLIEGVPEPSTWAGMLSGLAALGVYRRRRGRA